MKALILGLVTATLFYSAIQADRVKSAGIYQLNAIDLLDPSWPKLA